MEKSKRKIKVFDIILIIIILLLSGVFFFSSYKIYLWKMDNDANDNQKNNALKASNLTETNKGKKVNKPKNKFDPYWDFINYDMISVDFSKLLEMNSDTVGWINMKKSNINYPVVQTTDNSFYLNHDYNQKYNDAGWVFMDYRNDSTLNNQNTIIYAHSRVDGSMFHTLRNVVKESWFKDDNNRVIRLSTPNKNTLWLIFSAYTIEKESYYLKTEFESEQAFTSWLNKVNNRSKFDYNTEINSKDKVLTLSSCYTADGIRMVVHAKLIKEEAR